MHPKLRTVAVCDQKFTTPGVLPNGVRHFLNYLQLLDEPLDILFVCLPNYLAPDVTIAGLERGFHVFVKNRLDEMYLTLKGLSKPKRNIPNCFLNMDLTIGTMTLCAKQ